MDFTLHIDAPAQQVYTAITTTTGFQGWWARVCHIDCTPGHTSTVRFIKPSHTEVMSFITITATPGTTLMWQCTANNVFPSWPGTTLTFTITAHDTKSTTLTFTHTSPDAHWQHHPDYAPTMDGWSYFMDSLKDYCENGKGTPWG